MQVNTRIKEELDSYKTGTVELFDGCSFSASKLIRRILLYKNQHYPTGKRDSQGNYKYWFDIILPRRDSEIKNVDFDTKNVSIYSESDTDSTKVLIANGVLKEWLKNTKQGEKLNEAVEKGTEWGNVVWKKQKRGYRIMDLDKLMVLNQTAESIEDSDVIESEVMTPVDIRKKTGIWDNVDKLIEAGKKEYNKTAPEFFIYERNGEITTKEYAEAKGKTGGDEQTYILANIIVGGVKKDDPIELLFASKITKMPYKEYHRGTYSGRWLRIGMYELLFDVQTRANEIGNQIARGLEWSSKTIFRSSDRVIAQNILTDLQNGDIIKSIDLQQVQTRMEGFDQLVADWNRLMEMADRLANSYEVVTGESLPSGTPFRLGAMLNQNANKLFDFIREKLTIVFQSVIEDWVLPDLLKHLKSQDILRITGDEEWLRRYYGVLINSWYIRNLIAIGYHTPEEALILKEAKLKELLQNKEATIKLEKVYWEGFEPRAKVDITGERVALMAELETLANFINLESDPVRRTALIELAMKKKGIDVERLPKTTPEQMMAVAGRTQPTTPATPAAPQAGPMGKIQPVAR